LLPSQSQHVPDECVSGLGAAAVASRSSSGNLEVQPPVTRGFSGAEAGSTPTVALAHNSQLVFCAPGVSERSV